MESPTLVNPELLLKAKLAALAGVPFTDLSPGTQREILLLGACDFACKFAGLMETLAHA